MLTPNVIPRESWVFPFRSSGARPPLFFASAGSADAVKYRDFADGLPDDQPVYVFGLPAFGEELQFLTVEQLAAIYVQKVRKLQGRGPYQLCGFSLGGLVAYEMATQLVAEKAEVGLLALIDTLHPRYRQNLSPLQKANFYFTYFSDRLTKYGRNFLNLSMDNLASDVSRLRHRFERQLVAAISRRAYGKGGSRIPNSVHRSELVRTEAWRRYVPNSYDGQLLLLNAPERGPEYMKDRTLGWKTCGKGVITVHLVAGEHRTIMHPPYVRALAKQLTQYLSPPLPFN